MVAEEGIAPSFSGYEPDGLLLPHSAMKRTVLTTQPADERSDNHGYKHFLYTHNTILQHRSAQFHEVGFQKYCFCFVQIVTSYPFPV